jgi:hypothetical protein
VLPRSLPEPGILGLFVVVLFTSAMRKALRWLPLRRHGGDRVAVGTPASTGLPAHCQRPS